MFSIVTRSRREAEKERYNNKKEKVKALRAKVKRLQERIEKLTCARDEARSQVMELEGAIANTPGATSLLRRLTEAESWVAELEKAIVITETDPLPKPLPFPLPPPRMRRLVGGSFAGATFLAGCRAKAECVDKLVRGVGEDPAAFRSVLDWGCGCGRMGRQAREVFPRANYHGLDVDGQAIEWCREHLGTVGHFEVCAELPPLPCAAGSFDFIMALSVFTHLRLDAEKRWLAELARVARPGALLCLSFLRDETPATFGLGPAQVVDSEDGFTCYATWAGDGLPYYNLTSSHTEACLRKLWGEWFDILTIEPNGLMLQGAVMARARG